MLLCTVSFASRTRVPRLFGPGQDFKAVSMKVIADALGHVPLLYLPLYYSVENALLRDVSVNGLADGFQQYLEEWQKPCFAYWKMWPAFHFLNFMFTPKELRISCVAAVSFVWLVILSVISHEKNELMPSSASSHDRQLPPGNLGAGEKAKTEDRSA